MFLLTFSVAVCAVGFLSYQIGAQLVAKDVHTENWSTWKLLVVGIVSIATMLSLPLFPQTYSDGTSAPAMDYSIVSVAFALIAVIALIHGYGLIRLLTLIIYGKEAAYSDQKIPRKNTQVVFVDQYHGEEIEALRMKRLAEYEKHISSNEKRQS